MTKSKTVLKVISKHIFCLIMIIAFSCNSNDERQSIENQKSTTEIQDVNDPYLTGCPSYSVLYDRTERINKNTSNRFIGVYGFFESDSICWDHLYEDANNLVPPDTNITTQNVFFIRVNNKTSITPVTNIKQVLNSDSLKKEVVASGNTFEDKIQHFPFRKL